MRNKKVAIIGGGIIGLMLASRLAEYNIETTIFERKKNIDDEADKASGILSVEGLKKISLPYDNAIINGFRGADFFIKDIRFEVYSKKTKAYLLDRKKLAVECMKFANEKGVDIRLNSGIKKEDIRNLSKEYEVIVGADGALSDTAETFEFPRIKKYLLTYKTEYEINEEVDSSKVNIYLDTRKNGFFGWIAPHKKNRIEVGIGVESNKNISSKIAFNNFTKKIEDILKDSHKLKEYASIIPIERREITVKGNILLVGDAAGQVKASTGGGIVYGVLCSYVAADKIREHFEHRSTLMEYENAWRKRFGLDFAANSLLHNYYVNSSDFAFDHFIKLLKAIGMEKVLGKYGDMDSPIQTIKNIIARKSY
ncbi:MAG: NAD(P)/FAD-dependent oxidoreductase [Candidatus Micrarchaeaceae archaeon]